MTRVPGLLLVVKTADCLPLSPGRRLRVAAAVHAGWRGTRLRIVETIRAMMAERFGTNPADVLAAMGRASDASCYEVGEDVRSEFLGRISGRIVRSRRPARPNFFDLCGANELQLRSAGVPPERIDLVEPAPTAIPASTPSAATVTRPTGCFPSSAFPGIEILSIPLAFVRYFNAARAQNLLNFSEILSLKEPEGIDLHRQRKRAWPRSRRQTPGAEWDSLVRVMKRRGLASASAPFGKAKIGGKLKRRFLLGMMSRCLRIRKRPGEP